MQTRFADLVSWLKQVVLHAFGHAIGVAIAASVVLLFATVANAPTLKHPPPPNSCPAPVEFFKPEIWPASQS